MKRAVATAFALVCLATAARADLSVSGRVDLFSYERVAKWKL